LIFLDKVMYDVFEGAYDEYLQVC